MITLNLLPEEFRVKEKTASKYPVVPVAIGVGALFILLTVVFYVDFLIANWSYQKLQKESAHILPQSQKLKQLDDEVEKKLKPENGFLNRFVTADKPLTELLLWASEYLPVSAWLTEAELKREGDGGKLLLRGLTLPTKEKSSIEQIETFVHHFKEKMTGAELSLTTSRQNFNGVEVTELVVNYRWGTGEPVK